MMRKKDVKGLMHDLLDLLSWRNPLYHVLFEKTITVDLLKGEVIGTKDDDLFTFYHEKIDWFQKRIKDLGVKEGECAKATITVKGFTEKVDIEFKEETYSQKRSFT